MQPNPNETKVFEESYNRNQYSGNNRQQLLLTPTATCQSARNINWCLETTLRQNQPTWTHLSMMSRVTIETSDTKSSINCLVKRTFLGSVSLSAFTKCSAMLFVYHNTTHTHTHTFNGPLSQTTRVSRYQKGKTNLDLLEQETGSGNGISWTICKSASRSRQITTPASHHSVFYRPDALPAAQPTASKHWRHSLPQHHIHLFQLTHTQLISKHVQSQQPWDSNTSNFMKGHITACCTQIVQSYMTMGNPI